MVAGCSCLTDLHTGLRTTKFEALLKLKAQTAELIKTKLSALFPYHSTYVALNYCTDQAAHPDQIGRMYYSSFKTSITDRYGIIIEGWPLEKFVCPSSINCKVSIEILHTAWANGTARFRRLTPEELRVRYEARHVGLVENITTAPTVATESDTAVSFDINLLDPALRNPAPSGTAAAVSAPVVPVMPAVQAESSHAVFAVAGTVLVPVSKRKVRSDKGTKHGSYKNKKSTTASTVATTVSPV